MILGYVTSFRLLPKLAALLTVISLGSVWPALNASAANVRPVISGTPPQTAVVGQAYSFTPSAYDPDGKSVSFGIRNQPSWAKFNRTTGALTGTPTAPGTFSGIQIYAWDGVYAATLYFGITVTAKSNTAPTISGTPTTTITAGQAYSFKPTAKDADGDALGFSIANKPSWASFSTSTGALTGTPSAAGTFSNVTISVSDGKASKSLSPFTITVKAGNQAPKISGTPTTSINANSAYSFRPSASDADGDTLKFTIANKPSWASFSTTTGQLSGTPSAANVGVYSGVVISVSDGKVSTSLPSFAIAVNAVSLGSATLSWTPPTQNTDGTSLSNLAGYRIVYGVSATALNQTIEIANPSVSTYVVDGLSPSTYYFAVRAYTSGGQESANSNVASKSVK
jgi:hypothetical protein